MFGPTLTPSDMGIYDSAAASYFARAEALGGSFDLTGINGTYTADYVKEAINDFVESCKDDGIWDKLTEVVLLCGVTFAGITKLKYAGTPELDLGFFQDSDYVAAGSGLGLKGNGTQTKIDTSKPTNDFNPFSMHLSACVTVAPTNGVSGCFIGASVTGGNLLYLGRLNSGADDGVDFSGGGTTRASATVAARTGIYVGVAVSQTSRVLYRNGVSIGTNSNSGTNNLSSTEVTLFNATGQLFSNARLACASIGTQLTPTEAANFTTYQNTLMTALGGGVF